MPPPSKPPGAARRSRNRNARKLSPIYATGYGGGGWEKHDRLQTARRSAAFPNPLDEGEKKKVRMRLTLKNTPCRAPTDRRCHTPAAAATPPLRHPTTVLSLLPPSHINIKASEGGDMGSHTSPQSSWNQSKYMHLNGKTLSVERRGQDCAVAFKTCVKNRNIVQFWSV